jgi:hypothetical protein
MAPMHATIVRMHKKKTLGDLLLLRHRVEHHVPGMDFLIRAEQFRTFSRFDTIQAKGE